MQYYFDEMMNQMVADRRESIARDLEASQHRNVLLSRIGQVLIWAGERLRQDTPSRAEVISVYRRRQSRPGLT